MNHQENIVNNRILSLANRAADAAGEIARRWWRAPLVTEHKSDHSPVTQADRDIETAIRQLIEEHYPEHGIVGEEEGNVRPESPWQWVVDPIDGTRSFIAGYPMFTTLIALCYHGTPQLGIIEQPVLKERWIGVMGERTTLNGKPVATRAVKVLAQATVATTSTYYFNDHEDAAFDKLQRECGQVVLGGDAYAYAMLATGRTDVVADVGMKPYDFCALAPIIKGAGGIITDWRGEAITLTSDGRVIAAANKELYGLARQTLGA